MFKIKDKKYVENYACLSDRQLITLRMNTKIFYKNIISYK